MAGRPKCDYSELVKVKVTPEMKEKLEEYSNINNCTISDIVRKYIEHGLENTIVKEKTVPYLEFKN